eukprot:1234299-Pyramimonas_sp.AAC.1
MATPPSFTSRPLPFRTKTFGHPRVYATWTDETLNNMLSRLAESAHSSQHEKGVFERLDLQAHLGIGAAKSTL